MVKKYASFILAVVVAIHVSKNIVSPILASVSTASNAMKIAK